MPKIIYGTAWKADKTMPLVISALAAGFRALDTACQPKHYNESAVGAALEEAIQTGLCRREDIFLQTKFTPLRGQDPDRVPYDPCKAIADQVAESVSVSLSNLRTAYVDCLLLHSPFREEEETLEAWKAMEGAHDNGHALRLGVSNCYDRPTLETIVRKARVRPCVLQNRFYSDTDHDRALRAYAAEEGIAYESFWTLTANQHVLADQAYVALARELGVTPAALLFRYCVTVGIMPLTGTSSEEHMRDDLAAASAPPLLKAQVQTVEKALFRDH